MKKSKVVILFLSLFTLSFSLNYLNEEGNKKELNSIVYVSLKNENDDVFYQELISNIGFNFRKVDKFDTIPSVNILSLKINSEDIDLISSFSSVEFVQKEVVYQYNPDDPSYSYLVDGEVRTENDSLSTMNYVSEIGRGENTFLAVLDSGFNLEHEAFSPIPSSFEKVKESDIENIVKSNEDFNGDDYLYYNNKVVFSHDYSMDDNDVLSTSYHGTHVASIASGNGQYKGIAYNSQLALMKIFNDSEGGCTSGVYLRALEDCYLLGVDAINMSIGMTLNYETFGSDQAVQKVFQALKEDGVNIFVSAGNDGRDSFNSSIYNFSPLENVESDQMSILSKDTNVITVGATFNDNDVTNIYGLVGNRSFRIYDRIVDHIVNDNGSYTTNEIENEHRFYDLIDKTKEYEYVYVPNYGDSQDYENLGVKDKIVIIDRGEIPFYVKIHRAIENGAKALIIVNSENETSMPWFDFTITDENFDKYPNIPYVTNNGVRSYDLSVVNIPVSMVSYTLRDYLTEREDKTITFYNENIATYSNIGPSADLDLKVDIVTPGSNVYGALGFDTVSGEYSSSFYDTLNGTSMAAPNAAGAYLALLSSFSDSDNLEVKEKVTSKMLNSGKLLEDKYGQYYSPRKQGSGLLDLEASYKNSGYFEYNGKSNISLKELNNEEEFEFEVNFIEEKESQTYRAKLLVMVPQIFNEKINEEEVLVKDNSDYLIDEVDLGIFTSQIGENKYRVNYSFPNTLKDYLTYFENGTYIEGYLIFENEENHISIPYLSFSSDYSAVPVYEDFNFLKDPSKVYESDIVEQYAKSREEKTYLRVGSYFFIGQDEDYYLDYMVNGEFDIMRDYQVLEGYKDEANNVHVYSGINLEEDDELLIQLFMLRSVTRGRISILDQNNNQIYSSTFKDTSNFIPTSSMLYRSYIQPQEDFLTNGEYVPRSYAFIPLDVFLNEGTYRINFIFSLVNSEIYTSTIYFHFNERYLNYSDIINFVLNGNNLRIYLTSSEIEEVLLNNKRFDYRIIEESSNIILEINIDDCSSEKNVISIENSDNLIIKILYYKDYGVIVGGREISDDISISQETNGDIVDILLVNEENALLYSIYPLSYAVLKNDVDNIHIIEDEYYEVVTYQATDDNDFINFKTNYSQIRVYKSYTLLNILIIVAVVILTILILITILLILSFIYLRKSNKR